MPLGEAVDEFSASTRELQSVKAEGTRNGVHKGPAHQGRGVAVIKMGEVYAADMIDDADRDRFDLSAGELERLSVHDGDLLFCRTSIVPDGVGHCAIVRSLREPTVFASNLIRVRLDRQRAEPRYWLYYFRSPEGKHGLLSLARGTSVTTITGPDISSLSVPLPPLKEQRAIARVLGTLDDRIELNRRMSETLEEMARALFRSWFVDFDPVRAKVAGRPSGLPPALDALFPASFEASELGEIPAGWEVIPAGEAMKVHGGSTPSTKERSYWGGEHCFATPKDLSTLQEPILKSSFRELSFLVPAEPIHAAWGSLVAPLYDVVASNARQSRSVVVQRDALLPRLVSGELRVGTTP